jgi:hypothetical protein
MSYKAALREFVESFTWAIEKAQVDTTQISPLIWGRMCGHNILISAWTGLARKERNDKLASEMWRHEKLTSQLDALHIRIPSVDPKFDRVIKKSQFDPA